MKKRHKLKIKHEQLEYYKAKKKLLKERAAQAEREEREQKEKKRERVKK